MKNVLLVILTISLISSMAWIYVEKNTIEEMNQEWQKASEYDFKYINKLADFIKLQNTLHPAQFTKEEDVLFNEIKQLKDSRSKFIRQFSYIYPVYKARESK